MSEDIIGRITFSQQNCIEPIPKTDRKTKQNLNDLEFLQSQTFQTFNSLMEFIGYYKLINVNKDDNILEDDLYVYGDNCEKDVKRGM